MARRLVVEFVGDSKNLEKTFSNVRGETDKTGSSLNKVQGPAKAAGLALGAGLAVAAKEGFEELAEGQKVSAQTAAVLKSTGGAANVTAKDMETLAERISNKSGIDDEAIQSGENLLATFTNVRNETGKGNDVFNQSTAVMADMSVALGQDMKSSAMQLGKALNDPAKGLTKLQRIGVTFTAAQEKQVKAMAKAGDTAGAQKIILKELNKEFGGSAKAAGDTFPGQLNKLKNSFSEITASMVQILLPALQKLGGALSKGAAFLQEHEGLSKALGVGLVALTAIMLGVSVATKVASAATFAWNAITKIAAATQWLFNAAMAANPIGLVIIAIAALVAGFILAYKHSEKFREIIDALWDAIKGFAKWVAGAAVAAFKVFAEALELIFKGIKLYITTYFNVYKAIITTAWTVIKTVTTTVWNAIKTVVTGVWNTLRLAAATTFNAVKTAILTPIRLVRDGLAVIWNTIKTVAGTAWHTLRNTAATAWEKFKDVILGPVRFVREKLGDIWDAIKDKATSVFAKLKDAAVSFGTSLKNAIVSGFATAINAVIYVLNKAIWAFNKLPGPNIGQLDYVGAKAGAVVGAARGGAFGQTGGMIRAPMMLMGEEAPRHPEIVIPTNPAYRRRAQQLTGMAMGAVGFAQGGLTPYTGALNAGAGMTVQVNVANGMEWLSRYIDVRIVERDRSTAGTYQAGIT